MKRPSVILIEPDKLLASNIQKALAKRGLSCRWQTSAEQGILAADKAKPAAVILDLQLAGHSGVEFLHELRSYGDWQDLPVIVYSSIHPDSLGGEKLVKAGLTLSAYVHKPSFGLNDLVDAVEKALSVSQIH